MSSRVDTTTDPLSDGSGEPLTRDRNAAKLAAKSGADVNACIGVQSRLTGSLAATIIHGRNDLVNAILSI